MANSGSFNTSAYSDRYLQFSWSVKSQSVETNKTVISWSLKGAGGSTTRWYMAGNFKVVINGSTVYSSSDRIELYNGTVVSSGEFTISHNSDGTKNFSASAEAGIYMYAVNCTGSGSWDLPTIPRASKVTLSKTTFNIGEKITINTNRYSTAFTHSIIFYFGNYQKTLATGVTDSYQFDTSTVANNMYQQIPNAGSGVGNIQLITYNGSTQIGTSEQTFTANITDANPTFNCAYLDTNSITTAITQDNQYIIRNNSTLRINVTNAEAKKYSTLARAEVVINGKTYQGTISNGSSAINVGKLNLSSNATADVYVYDSRGKSTKKQLTIKIYNWVLPTAIITMQRHNNYYSDTDINVNAEYSSIGSKNTIAIKYRIKKTDTSAWGSYQTLSDAVTATFTADNDYAWDVQVVLTDRLGTTTYNLILSRGMPIIYFDRMKSSTGFNCFPKKERSVEIDGKTIVDLIYPVGAVYISATQVDPSTLFGGTWVQIKDRFMLSAGDTYTAGNTGGSTEHVHKTPLGFDETSLYGYAGSDKLPAYGSTVLNGKRIHTPITSDTGAMRIGSTDKASNLPPYVVVYVWKRTA